MTFLETIIEQKKQELPSIPSIDPLIAKTPKSILEKMEKELFSVIAEVKKASPSKGIINEKANPVKQATSYEKAGAAAISVLTDSQFFKGAFDDLKQITSHVSIPVLCKDFIIDKKQIDYARYNGASFILLIVAALSAEQLQALYTYAKSLKMDVLVETHNEQELFTAQDLGASLIGVNNRDLHTFDVDLMTSQKLSHHFSRHTAFYISESGYAGAEQAKMAQKWGYRGILVGETLMRSNDVSITMTLLKGRQPCS